MAEFSCRMCGACCTGEGNVYLFPDDVKRLATHFEVTVQEFVDSHTSFVLLEVIEDETSFVYYPYLILKKDEKNACLLLREGICSVHSAKPWQCANTPFVAEFFEDKEWQKDVAAFCPGVAALSELDVARYHKQFVENGGDKKEDDYFYLLTQNRFSLEDILSINLPSPDIISYNHNE